MRINALVTKEIRSTIRLSDFDGGPSAVLIQISTLTEPRRTRKIR